MYGKIGGDSRRNLKPSIGLFQRSSTKRQIQLQNLCGPTVLPDDLKEVTLLAVGHSLPDYHNIKVVLFAGRNDLMLLDCAHGGMASLPKYESARFVKYAIHSGA
jgi:hypothetical protein